MSFPQRFKWMVPVLGAVAVLTVGILLDRSEGKNGDAQAQEKEIVITIGDIDRSLIAEGDSLRKAYKFREAVASYQNFLETQGAPVSLRAEAEYNIGLSFTWLGEYDSAEAVFNRMLDEYRYDPNAVGYAEYCLAWIEVQKGKYDQAIRRWEHLLNETKCPDRELCARAQFDIGKIYMNCLRNKDAGIRALKVVVRNYPETRMYNHPWLDPLKNK